jgi:hypothetical protein
LQQRCSTGRSNSRCAWESVGGIAAQGYKIRNLSRFDAIPHTNLGGTDARPLAGTDRIEDGGAVRGKLERVAVAARNEYGAAALFFCCGSGSEKIIRLEAGRFRILKAACGVGCPASPRMAQQWPLVQLSLMTA